MVVVTRVEDSAPGYFPARIKIHISVALPDKQSEDRVVAKVLAPAFLDTLAENLGHYNYQIHPKMLQEGDAIFSTTWAHLECFMFM